MSCDTGKDSGVSHSVDLEDSVRLAERLMALLRDATFLPPVYPTLFSGGVAEGSLHAYMLSAFVLVGDRLGYSPVSDAPIFDRLDKLLMGEGAKRPDAVWFQRGQDQIRCMVEFERFTHRALVPKAKNLLVMGKEVQPTPHLAVLNYWTYASVPDTALLEVQSIFASGFRHATGLEFPPLGCPALVLETLVTRQDMRTIVQAVLPRLFVYGRENKPYIIHQLGVL